LFLEIRRSDEMVEGSEPKSSPASKLIASFMLQQVISTAGAMLLGVLATMILATLTAVFAKGSHPGDFLDLVVDQYIVKGVDQPYYPMLILAGFTLGSLNLLFFRTRTAVWVWVLPLCILLWNIFTWETGGHAGYWQDVWANYFSSNCGSSECLYELFVTVPFYVSSAYSIGWLVTGLVASKRG
jgi:hypothetical protein